MTDNTPSSWMPTRKWWATQVTAATALAIMWATTGSWDQEETISAIGLASQALLSWLVPNDPAAAGGRGEQGLTLVEALIVLIVVALFVLVVLLLR